MTYKSYEEVIKIELERAGLGSTFHNLLWVLIELKEELRASPYDLDRKIGRIVQRMLDPEQGRKDG